MKITRLAQSTILIEDEGRRLAIDPGNYNFEPGRLDRSEFPRVDVLIVTHEHADHFDLEAVQAICTESSPLVLTTETVKAKMNEGGVEATVLLVDETVESNGYRITGVNAEHVVRGQVVDIFGVLVESNGKSVYHTSDTTYLDQTPREVDVVFVPINNRGVAMDFADAARFVREVNPKVAVPVHYDSPKDSHLDPYAWVELLSDSEIEARVMQFGESLEL